MILLIYLDHLLTRGEQPFISFVTPAFILIFYVKTNFGEKSGLTLFRKSLFKVHKFGNIGFQLETKDPVYSVYTGLLSLCSCFFAVCLTYLSFYLDLHHFLFSRLTSFLSIPFPFMKRRLPALPLVILPAFVYILSYSRTGHIVQVMLHFPRLKQTLKTQHLVKNNEGRHIARPFAKYRTQAESETTLRNTRS